MFDTRWPAGDRSPSPWWLVGWGASLVATGYLCYVAAQNNKRLQVRRYEVKLPNLDAKLDGFRICHMTDFHQGPWLDEEHLLSAVGLCNVLEPDLVVLTGDYITRSEEFTEPAKDGLRRICAPRGVYGVLGNHDHHDERAPKVAQAVSEAGVTMLTNANEELGDGLWIAGIDDWTDGDPDFDAAVAGIPDDAPVIFLSHNPSAAHYLKDWNALILSGHTHGGQIKTPEVIPDGIEERVEEEEYDTPVAEGWYSVGRAQLYVNRGVGMGQVRLRFWQRPEVALITLHPDGDAVASSERDDLSATEIPDE